MLLPFQDSLNQAFNFIKIELHFIVFLTQARFVALLVNHLLLIRDELIILLVFKVSHLFLLPLVSKKVLAAFKICFIYVKLCVRIHFQSLHCSDTALCGFILMETIKFNLLSASNLPLNSYSFAIAVLIDCYTYDVLDCKLLLLFSGLKLSNLLRQMVVLMHTFHIKLLQVTRCQNSNYKALTSLSQEKGNMVFR